MSAETLKAIEDAIAAHAEACDQLGENGLVTAWIIGYEMTGSDTEHGIAFGRAYAASDTSPATSVGLANWASRQIEADAMPAHTHWTDDEDT